MKKTKKVTSKNITDEQIEEVNECFGFEEGARDLTDAGYAFLLQSVLLQ